MLAATVSIIYSSYLSYFSYLTPIKKRTDSSYPDRSALRLDKEVISANI